MNVPITVLMSVYNGERWLDEAIESIINQTFGDFEFLIVNDGSTDSSLKIINQYSIQDSRIDVIDKPNTGLADSLNQGIKVARGEWIARIDADDLCSPHRLNVQYSCAKSNERLVLIGSSLNFIDEKGHQMKLYRYPSNNKQLLRYLFKNKSLFAHSSAFYRTYIVQKLGGYRTRMKRAQDTDLWLRLSEVGQMHSISEPLVSIRRHSEQISNDNKGRRQAIDARVAFVSYLLRQSNHPDPISENTSESEFERFREYISHVICKDKYFEYRDFILKVKSKYLHGGFKGLTSIILLLLRNLNFFIRYLFDFLWSEKIEKKLAVAWVKQDSNIVIGQKPLTLGIDATNLLQGGGRTHLIELLRYANPYQHGISKMVVWGSRSTLSLLEDREWLIKRSPPALEGGLLHRSLWQRFKLSQQARNEGCDILFVPGGSYAGNFQKVVCMNQNLLPFEWQELKRYGVSKNTLKFVMLRWIQSSSFKRCGGVIFLTRYAKKSVELVTGNLCGKAKIIPHGLNCRFQKPPKVQESIDAYSHNQPFRLLYVSMIDQYKHQWNVVEAVGELRKQTGWPLVLDLIGPAYPLALDRLVRAMNIWDPRDEWIKYYGAVPYTEMDRIYGNADLCIWASSCETFGMILLEGMASGLPIASSNRGPMPEILGDAGIYFDPENPNEIKSALENLIESTELRTTLSKKSFEASKQYTWEKCATETFEYLAYIAMKKKDKNESIDK